MQKSGAPHESTEAKSWQGEDYRDEAGQDPERPFTQSESWPDHPRLCCYPSILM